MSVAHDCRIYPLECSMRCLLDEQPRVSRYLDDDGSPEWTAIAEELRALGVNSKRHPIIMRKPQL